MVGVQTDLREKVKGHRQAGRAICEEVLIATVRFLGISHAGILPHGPETPTVHCRLNAACERVFSRIADLCFVVRSFEIGGRVQRLYWNVRRSLDLRSF